MYPSIVPSHLINTSAPEIVRTSVRLSNVQQFIADSHHCSSIGMIREDTLRRITKYASPKTQHTWTFDVPTLEQRGKLDNKLANFLCKDTNQNITDMMAAPAFPKKKSDSISTPVIE
ncbi:MAG: hypothetical protein GY941_07825 [Planctomycetes bacterium]|nr:hypothetical protein [Planctomycetota bacterium]